MPGTGDFGASSGPPDPYRVSAVAELNWASGRILLHLGATASCYYGMYRQTVR